MTESAFHLAFTAVLDDLIAAAPKTNWDKLSECGIDQHDFISAVTAIVLHQLDDADAATMDDLTLSGALRVRTELVSEALMLGLLTGKALGFGQAVTI